MAVVTKLARGQLAAENRVRVATGGGVREFLVGQVTSSFYPDLANAGYVRPGQPLICWAPDPERVAECWVSWSPPHDPVRVQVGGDEFTFCLDDAADAAIAAAPLAEPQCDTYR